MTWCICYFSNLDQFTESRKPWRFLRSKKYCAGHLSCHINGKPAVMCKCISLAADANYYSLRDWTETQDQTSHTTRCAKTRQKTSWTLSTKFNLSHDTEVVFKVDAKVNYGFSIDDFFNFLIKLSTSWLCEILSHRKNWQFSFIHKNMEAVYKLALWNFIAPQKLTILVHS